MQQKGFSIIELLVAISFVSSIVILIFTLGSFNSRILKYNKERTEAIFYASEAVEALKMFSWNELISDTNYNIFLNVDRWELGAGDQLLAGKYTRTINIASVSRSSTSNGQVYGEIVDLNGYPDPDTKKITVTISWGSMGDSQSEEITTYFHRWQASRWEQADWAGGVGQADWADPTKFFSNDSGMDVSLAGVVTLKSGFLDWNNGTTTDTYNISGSATVNDIFELDQKAYLVSANNTSGQEFHIFDVSDIYNPVLLGSYEVGSTVTGVAVKGDYAYLSTYSNSTEIIVLNVSDPDNINLVDVYDLTGDYNAYDIAIDDTELYVARDNMLYSFSIATPYNVQGLDEISIDSTTRAIFLSGDYIYVSANDDNRELQIFDVTNPANLQAADTYDLPGGTLDATDVYVQGNSAYVSTLSNSNKEFYIFDVSDPYDIAYLGAYERGASIYSFTIVGPYALLGSNSSSEELTVIDVSFPATINKAAGYNLSAYLYAMAANCANIYTGTSNTSQELLIFSTEDSDCGYADFGVLESSTYDTGSSEVAYNWIAWSGIQPADTQIKFQLATSNNVNGPWIFVGPNGANSSYYSTASQEFINYNYHLNQRYVRYKLFLETNASLDVPVLETVVISYSSY